MTQTQIAATGTVRRGELGPRNVSTLQRLRECEWVRKAWADPANQTEQYSYECPACGGEQHLGHRDGCAIAECIAEHEAHEVRS